jgi:hypothetical protein
MAWTIYPGLKESISLIQPNLDRFNSHRSRIHEDAESYIGIGESTLKIAASARANSPVA